MSYFVFGGFLVHFTNKNKENDVKKKNWTKYFVYLLILNVLFASIFLDNKSYVVISAFIVAFGAFEIILNSAKQKKSLLGLLSVIIFSVFSYLFVSFSLFEKSYLFYSLFIVTVFDGFSQLSGQLFGKRKILPKISPNKTFEGVLGGLLFTVVSSVFIRNLLELSVVKSVVLGFGVAIFAFIGDVLASMLKRKLSIKDFSNLIPGHGGFLDRFDSMIVANSFLFVVYFVEGI